MHKWSCLLILVFAVAACGPKPEEEESVRAFFEHVRLGQFDAVQDDLGANLKTPETQAQLVELRRQYIPAEAPNSVTRTNWSFNQVFGGNKDATFIHRYDYPDRVLIVTTVTRAEREGPVLIVGFHVNVTPLTPEVAAAGEFSFANKTTVHYAFFASMMLSLVLMLTALIGAPLTKGFKRKWLWVIIALLGGPVFVMNWATGEWAPTFTFGLLNMGATKGLGPVDPWILKFQLPIGALVVLSLLWPRWAGRAPAEAPGD